jgi:hypothetical protein
MSLPKAENILSIEKLSLMGRAPPPSISTNQEATMVRDFLSYHQG